LPLRLSKIDELTRPDHTFIEADDECFYLSEYNARKGYQFSKSNNLIFNLKKPMDRRGQAGWAYKRQAIETAGREMRSALDALNEGWLSTATLVPIPPSKVKTDPLYDDRLIQMLQVLGAGIEVDVRELIVQKESRDAAHATGLRPRINELLENYFLDESLAEPAPKVIGVVDDVLTTGAHFKAAKRLLSGRFATVAIYGLFVARRVPDSRDIS
jgi:hypothetical protein